MTEKDKLIFSLKRLERRVTFRSSERVRTSLFFHVLFSILDRMNNMNEEEIEKELEGGRISFVHYSDAYKVTLKVELREIKGIKDD